MVCTRNLSAGGMSFMHGGFLHSGTDIRVALSTNDGSVKTLLGKVRTCRLITRNIHEVGVEFNEKIDAEMFCTPGSKRSSDDPSISIELPDLSGNALVIGGTMLERRVICSRLKSSGMNAVGVESLGAGVDQLKLLPYVLVVSDMKVGDAESPAIVQALRLAGFEGPVVGVAENESPIHAAVAKTAGMNGYVAKPINANSLLQVAARTLRESGLMAKDDRPIHSSLANDSGTQQLIEYYINQTQQQAVELENALKTANGDTLRRICQAIKSTAGGYGFAPVAEAARQSLTALDACGSVEEAQSQVQVLLDIVLRMKSGKPEERKGK